VGGAAARLRSQRAISLGDRRANHYIRTMCGRVIQSRGPIRLAIVEGLDARDSRVHNYPPRWNAAPSQDLLVIRRNHHTGEIAIDPLRWGLIPYWCEDAKGRPKANQREV
jgi:putative SOS response-associated peptidase YedK